MTEFSKPSPNQEQPLPAPALFKMLGHTAIYGYTQLVAVFDQPPPPLFQVMEETAVNFPQPLHPDIATTSENIKRIVEKDSVIAPSHLSTSDKLAQSPRIMQFTNRIGSNEQAFLHYDSIKTLKDQFVALAEKQGQPLGFDQQLDIALELNKSNVMDALTALWLSSRQYARWLDSVAIRDLPEMSEEDILIEMMGWRSSILACKNADATNFQDTAGDSYYAWTHALSRVMYGNDSSIPSRIGKFIFGHGTAINSRVRIFKQSIPSDHRTAAAYGNHIGDAILDVIKTK